MDYKHAAQQVLDCIGGKDNIVSAAHCATRLRLVIADNAKVNNRRKGKDLCDPQLLQGKDIGPIVDLMGRDTVVQSVPGQEVDFMAGSRPFQAVGTAKRRGDSKGSELSETGRILYTGAADDPDFAQSYHLFGFVSSSSESKSPRSWMV